jgi:hypothetical protein
MYRGAGLPQRTLFFCGDGLLRGSGVKIDGSLAAKRTEDSARSSSSAGTWAKKSWTPGRGLKPSQKIVIAELELVENSFLRRADAAHRSSYLAELTISQMITLAPCAVASTSRILSLLVACNA